MMGKIVIILAVLAVTVAIAPSLLALWRGAHAAGSNPAGAVARTDKGCPMAPNGLQKIAYLALLALLLALSLGLTGGL